MNGFDSLKLLKHSVASMAELLQSVPSRGDSFPAPLSSKNKCYTPVCSSCHAGYCRELKAATPTSLIIIHNISSTLDTFAGFGKVANRNSSTPREKYMFS